MVLHKYWAFIWMSEFQQLFCGWARQDERIERANLQLSVIIFAFINSCDMIWAANVSSDFCIERNLPYKSSIERDVLSEKWYWRRMFFSIWVVAIYQRLVVAGDIFFLLLELGPGAAACGMGIEINTGYSCYLSAARRRRGRFFSPIGSGPGGSGWWNGDRDKHWVQLLFISGSSSPGAVFFSYWIWAQGQRLVEWG